jgi:hypothetical protein
VILLNTVRTSEALERRVKKTFNVRDLFIQVNETLGKELTDEVELAIGLQASDVVSSLKALGVGKKISSLKDESLKTAISPSLELLKEIDKVKETVKKLRAFGWFNLTVSVDERKAISRAQEFKKKYALLPSLTTYNTSPESADHLVMYLNAVHEHEENKQVEVTETLVAAKGN